MAQPIATSDAPVSYWARLVLAETHGEVEAMMNGQSELELKEIDEGSPILRAETGDNEFEFHFSNAEELRDIGEWMQTQADLVEGWVKHNTEVMEEAEKQENTNDYFREGRVGVKEWWDERE